MQRGQDATIITEGLVKRYGGRAVVDGFDLSVPAGTVCGLLGPNGAGKTTVVRILATLLRADGGRAEVAGIDVRRAPDEVRRRIGLSGQTPAVDEILSGTQNLVMFSRLSGMSKSAARMRAAALLQQFDLGDVGDRAVKHYSGGMRRRLDLAATLVLAPSVLFLDEPTTGLDPRNRNEMWAAIRALVAAGSTVLLTTQYLDEADQLADQIVVMDEGRTIASGPPAALKSGAGRDRVEVTLHEQGDIDVAAGAIAWATGAEAEIDADTRRVTAAVVDRVAALTRVLDAMNDLGIEVADIGIRRPTLDDVFLQLTGHRTLDVPASGEEVAA